MGGCRKSFEEYAKQIIYLIMSYDKVRIYYQGYDERSRTYRTKKYTINLNKATIEYIERYGLNNISIAYWVYGFEIRGINGNVLLTKNDYDLEVKDVERWEWLSSTDTKKDEPKAEPKAEPIKETPKAQPTPAPKAEPKKEAHKPEVRRPSADDMNVLDKLIDAALEDFVLTDEERSVLLKKSKEIGLGEDEFKIYLNGKIQERMKDKPAEKVEEKKKGFFARLFG